MLIIISSLAGLFKPGPQAFCHEKNTLIKHLLSGPTGIKLKKLRKKSVLKNPPQKTAAVQETHVERMAGLDSNV